MQHYAVIQNDIFSEINKITIANSINIASNMDLQLFVKRAVYKMVQSVFKWWYGDLPLIELEQQHIEGCTVLTNRVDLLKKLPKGKVIVELGVEHGLFSKDILKYCNPIKLYLVDWWKSDTDFRIAKERLSTYSNIKFVKKTSIEYLDNQELDSIDIFYIDTDHTYLTTKQELIRAHKLLKKDGFICGHDYTSVDYHGVKKYGVVEAVNEFCYNYNYKFVYVTHEVNRYISYALQKIGD